MKTKMLKWMGLLVIALTGCYDFSQFDNIAVDPIKTGIAVPLMKSKITFKELAERSNANTIVEQYPGSDMYFVEFRDTIDIGSATSLFTIPPTSFSDNFQFDAGFIPPVFPAGISVGPQTKTFNQTYNSIAGAELKRIDLSGGTLQINLTNNFYHQISGTIELTSIKNSSGATLVLNFNLPNYGSTYNNTIDLTGYRIDLYDGVSTYNNIQYSVTATITSSGSSNLTGGIGIQLGINNPSFKQITGKVNYTYVHADQPYSINIFNSTILADQHIAQPKFTLKFINSFGIPSDVNFTRFEVENNQGTILPIVNDVTTQQGDLLIGTPNILKYATTEKPCDTTTLKLDYTNSNIENLFDIAPNKLSFGATFNLGDATANHDYFIRNDSKFQLLSDIEIPLLGWVVTNKITDTLQNIDWPDPKKDLHLLDDTTLKVKFKFKFTNELPLNMYLQIKFYDDAGTQVARLFDNDSTWFVKSSPVDVITGKSSGSTTAYSYVSIDRAKYDDIKQSKNMIVFYSFTTGGNTHQNVTILSTNSIAVDMSMEASGTFDPNNQ